MKKLTLALLGAAASLTVASPAVAETDASRFVGPRVGVVGGYDNFQDTDGMVYGVQAGWDLKVLKNVTVGPEVTFSDSTADTAGVNASRDVGINLRAGYVLSDNLLAFGKVGYANTRVEAGGLSANFEGVRFGGGLEYAFAKNMSASVEYARTEYEANVGGRDQVLVGLNYRF